jgi:hypothetical protein
MRRRSRAAKSVDHSPGRQERRRVRRAAIAARMVGRVRNAFYIGGVRAPSTFPVPKVLHTLGVLLLLLEPAAQQAWATGCSAAPAPGVDWRRCLMDGRDLAGADLTGAVLRDASLDRAVLRGTILREVDAPNVRFVSADLSGADLQDAVLQRADFTRADMTGAKLARADLRRARLFRADLTNADLTGARLEGADLFNATLDGARWTDGKRVCAAGSVGSCQ